MAENRERKYQQIISYVEDEVGIDVAKDLKKVVVSELDDGVADDGWPTDIERIGGVEQSGADLLAVLASVEEDELISRVADSSGSQVDPLSAQSVDQREDSTDSSGSGNAAQVDLGSFRRGVDVFYDVENDDGDIVVEVATGEDFDDPREWLRVEAGDIDADGEATFATQYDRTSYQHVRAYATDDYADGDVNTIEVVARGI